jgi:hypothetical protein
MEHARIPILNALRKSPFDGLLQHAGKVKECIKAFSLAVEHYCDEEYEEFDRLKEKVSELEHEADLIKGNVRAHLPKGIFMPVDKGDFLMCLREQDSILDYAEDAVLWLSFRKTKIGERIKEDFLNHLYKVVESVETLEKAMDNIRDLVSSFRGKKREEIKKMIKEVHQKEWEADEIERKLTKEIFEMDLAPMESFHLLKVVDLIAQIANHAENAGDRARAMIAK